jgi:protein-L-isoaspartate(D-aspartate) O-methyltransferase
MGASNARLALLLGGALASACASTPQSPPQPPPIGIGSSTASTPDDPPAAREARAQLVARIAAKRPSVSSRVLDAMRSVPRHLFVDAPMEESYRDRILRIGWGQTISQPSVVAMMTSALELDGSERVLEIGTGSGYQAAVLSRLAAHVDSIEIIAPLGEAARARLAALGYSNVEVRIGDGYLGWPEHAPYDRILLTAAPDRVPDALRDQLSSDGILVAPIGPERTQRLVRWRARGGKLVEEDLGAIRFVPMVH